MKGPRGIRWFALLVAMWMVLIVGIASPAWADDDDDDDDNSGKGNSHSQQGNHDEPAITTTTIAPTTLTTVPPAPPTTVPQPHVVVTTTTSTAPPITTTTAVSFPSDVQADQEPLEDPSVTTNTRASNPDEYESKETLVLAIAHPTDGEGPRPGDPGNGGFHILPREGLTVAFRSAVETIESQLTLAIVLGILIAGLTMVGFDGRKRAPTQELTRPAPLPKS